MDEAERPNSTNFPRVYVDAARWLELLRGLQEANAVLPNQAAALSAIVSFFDSIPAIRESGLTEPLHQLLLALPGMLRLVSTWNTLTVELATPLEADATMAAVACAQLRAFLRFSDSVAGEPLTRVLLPLAELLAEAEFEVQRWRTVVGDSA